MKRRKKFSMSTDESSVEKAQGEKNYFPRSLTEEVSLNNIH
jgi:hypothetical protein